MFQTFYKVTSGWIILTNDLCNVHYLYNKEWWIGHEKDEERVQESYKWITSIIPQQICMLNEAHKKK